jgi:hypothetical protein
VAWPDVCVCVCMCVCVYVVVWSCVVSRKAYACMYVLADDVLRGRRWLGLMYVCVRVCLYVYM